MKHTTLCSAITVALGSMPMAAQALSTGSILQFDPGIYSCVANAGAPPDNCTYSTRVTSGSFFTLDQDGSGTIAPFEEIAIEAHTGITLGSAQSASGTHFGDAFGAANNYTGMAPTQTGSDTYGNPIFITDGNGNNVLNTVTESPGIDEPWKFFGYTGMSFATTGITVVADDGAGNFELDFSGWRLNWLGVPSVDVGNGANAILTCSTAACEAGATFTLDYAATIPFGDPSGFGGVPYALHLVGGTIGEVPVPAAVWLFGSGLVGLLGIARRK